MIEDELYDCKNELEEAENRIKELEVKLEDATNTANELADTSLKIEKLVNDILYLL